MDAMKKALQMRRGKGIELMITIDAAPGGEESAPPEMELDDETTDLAPEPDEAPEAPLGLAERMKQANPAPEMMEQERMPGRSVETPTGKVPDLLSRVNEDMKKKKGL